MADFQYDPYSPYSEEEQRRRFSGLSMLSRQNQAADAASVGSRQREIADQYLEALKPVESWDRQADRARQFGIPDEQTIATIGPRPPEPVNPNTPVNLQVPPELTRAIAPMPGMNIAAAGPMRAGLDNEEKPATSFSMKVTSKPPKKDKKKLLSMNQAQADEQTGAAAVASSQGAATSPYDALISQLNERKMASLAQQQRGLEDLQNYAKLTSAPSGNTDLSPILSLYDTWFGGNLQKGYHKPLSADEAGQNLFNLQEKIQRGKGQLSETETDLLKSQLGLEEKKIMAGERATEHAENLADKKDTRKFQQAQLAETRLARLQASNDAKIYKAGMTFKEDLDPNKARGGNFAKAQELATKADKLLVMAKQFPDGNLPSAQVEELAQGLANMLTGSNAPASARVEAIVPHSVAGDSAKIAQWLKGEPTGAEQQAFVKLMLHTIDRERNLSYQQVKKIQDQRSNSPAAKLLKEHDPETYNALMEAYSPSEEQLGTETAMASAGSEPSLEELQAEQQRRMKQASK